MDHLVYGWGVPVVGGVWESFGGRKGGDSFGLVVSVLVVGCGVFI